MRQPRPAEPHQVVRAVVRPGEDAATVVRGATARAPAAIVVALLDRPTLVEAAGALAAGARVVTDAAVLPGDLDALVAAAAAGGPVVQLAPQPAGEEAPTLAERLHDGPIQRLTAARMQLGLAALEDPARRHERLDAVEAELAESADELAKLIRELGVLVRPRA